MLYICIPVHNEAPTIGVLLWKIRGALQDFSRDYELVVYDDGSTDVTAEVLEPYTRVLPLTVLTGTERRGYGAALDALARHVAAHTRYPRRDAMIVMQGDFTDRPEHIPELVKRFEGGADVVVTERTMADTDPTPARRLRRLTPWILRPFLRVEGVADPTSAYRLIRISVLRDALREAGDRMLVSEPGVAANAELLTVLAPFFRRVESVPVEPRYDVRQRPSRVRALTDAIALARFGWRNRKAGAAPARPLSATPVRPLPASEPPEPLTARRRDEPELAVADASRDEEPARRRKRPRRDDRVDEPAPRERPLRDRPPRERPPRPARPVAETGSPAARSVPADEATEVVSEAREPGDETAAPPRKRRKRRGAAGRARAEDGSATPMDQAPTDGGEPEASADAAPNDATADTTTDGATPTRARRRRSRRKRSTATGEAGDAGAPERSSPDGDRGGATSSPLGTDSGGDGGGDGDAAGEEGGAVRTGRSRRSRRGRRRGARGTASESGDGAADGGSPGSDAPAPSAAGPDTP